MRKHRKGDGFFGRFAFLYVVKAAAGEESAQATVEYALVSVATLAIVVGLAALWRAGENGVLARLVEQAASHVLSGLGALDIALY